MSTTAKCSTAFASCGGGGGWPAPKRESNRNNDAHTPSHANAATEPSAHVSLDQAPVSDGHSTTDTHGHGSSSASGGGRTGRGGGAVSMTGPDDADSGGCWGDADGCPGDADADSGARWGDAGSGARWGDADDWSGERE